MSLTLNLSDIGNISTNATNISTNTADIAANTNNISTNTSKLDTIESGATADQTSTEIKTAYESNADTNAYTDAEKTKLTGIEDGATADQTKADIDALGIDADTVDGLQASSFALDSSISTVGKTGDYGDLLNKPDLSVLNDVVTYTSLASFPDSGETGKVYIAEDTGYLYRWSGSAYVQLTDQTAIWGEITGTLSNQPDLQNALDANATDIAANTTNISTNATDIAANATNISTNATDIAANATNISTNTTDIATINETGVFRSNNELVVPSTRGVLLQCKNTSPNGSSGVNVFVINETSLANSTNTYTISEALVGGESFSYKAVLSCIPTPQSTTLTDTEVFMFDAYNILHCNSSVDQGDATDDGFQVQTVVRTIGGDTGITASNGRIAFNQSTFSIENTTSSDYDVRVEFTVLQGRQKIAM